MKKCRDCSAEKPLEDFVKDRRNSDGRGSYCKACKKSRIYAWRLAHPSAHRRISRKAYANLDEGSRDERLAGVRAYQKANPVLTALWRSARRSRLAANGTYEISRRDLRRLEHSPCAYCGSTDRLEMDHIIPIKRGGRHSIGNLQMLCFDCNRSKFTSLPIEYRTTYA